MTDARAFGACALGALALIGLGCASGGGTAPAAPAPAAQPAAPVTPAEPPPPPEPSPEPQPEAEPTGAYGPRTVVIEQPEVEEEVEPTLAEAARLARERRAREGGEPVAVITNETLSEFATGNLSVAEEPPADAAAADEPAGDPGSEPEAAAVERGEEYWRDRIRSARLRWRNLVEEIERTEEEAAELRQRFYAEDDGFYRDSQIKPAWDRALDRLAELRDRVVLAREHVETILLEGRQAGALPGWLREGIEYEPGSEEPEGEPGIHEATEPRVIDTDDDGHRR